MSTTNYLGLNIPDKNSKGRVVTEVFEPNFTKLDQNAEVVDIDKNAIWGGEYGGYIQDASVTKVVGKRYIDQFDGKAYECLVPSHENTVTNYQACNVKDNLSKLNNLILHEIVNGITYTKYSDGTMEIRGTKLLDKPIGDISRFDSWIYFDIPFTDNKYIPVLAIHGGNSGATNALVNLDNPVAFKNNGFKVTIIQAQTHLPLDFGGFVSFNIFGRWK